MGKAGEDEISAAGHEIYIKFLTSGLNAAGKFRMNLGDGGAILAACAQIDNLGLGMVEEDFYEFLTRIAGGTEDSDF
jgi:hypothetical protein